MCGNIVWDYNYTINIQDVVPTIITKATTETMKWCPIGFALANHTKSICYKRKAPQYFSEFYKDCSKNIFSTELYNLLDIDKSIPVWSEYKNDYPGGPFIDTKSIEHLGHKLDSKYNVSYQYQSLQMEKVLCIVINSRQSYTAVRCNEKHNTYCFVEPIAVDNDPNVKENCKDVKNSLTFSSPAPICLTVLNLLKEAARSGIEANTLCEKNSGLSLLSRGIVYANHPLFGHKSYPVKIFGHGSNASKVPVYEYGYLYYAAANYRYSDIICERSFAPVKGLRVNITQNDNGIKFLEITHTLKMKLRDIYCLSDSEPDTVKVSPDKYKINLTSYQDGYFWCVYRDPITYNSEISGKVLYIQDKESLRNVYALKLHLGDGNYNASVLEKPKAYLQEAKYFGKKYSTNVDYVKVKRTYLDGKTVLYHVKFLSRVIETELPSHRGVRRLHWRPVYYCDEKKTDHGDTVPQKSMNETVTIGGATYRCEGDFNEGVQWVEKESKTEKLKPVVDELERMVNESVSVNNITKAFRQLDDILETKGKIENPGNLLHLLDRLGFAIKLNESQTMAKAVGSHTALVVADVNSDRPMWGFKMHDRSTSQFTEESIEFMTSEVSEKSAPYSDNNEIVVRLPESVATSTGRISFVTFRDNGTLFSSDKHNFGVINSLVVSITVQNFKQFKQGEFIDIHLKPMSASISRNEDRVCAYWQFSGADQSGGYWSQAGCSFIRAPHAGMLDTCRCDHLTHFAEILVPRTAFTDTDETALEIISIVGCCLSILGMIMVAVTAVTFRTWRREFCNKIWLQLCVPIFFRSVCFLVIVFARFDGDYNIGCILVGIVLHYSVLSSFCWMLVAAVIAYQKLVLVFTRESSHKLLRAALFCYGAPCVVVGILGSVAPHSYAVNFKEKALSGKFCYPSGLGLWLAVVAPIVAILLVNGTLFALIFRSVFMTKRISRYGDSNQAVKYASVCCFLVFAFGLNWVAGLFAYNIVAVYLSSITGSFQGFILSIFFLLGNKETRNMWVNKIKASRKLSISNSTTTNERTNVFVISGKN